MKAYPRERFWSEFTLTPAIVAAYALAAGDGNPIHHDAQFASSTLNGEIIDLRGRIKAQDGQTALGARGRVLVTDRL